MRWLVPLLAAVILGYLVLARPGVTVFQLQGAAGYIAVPRSLEGWQLSPGSGDMLVTGHTRFGLMELEVERTGVPIAGDLNGYISERHARLYFEHDHYRVLLHGEYQPFGIHQAPTARAEYPGRIFGIPVQMVQHDAYWQLDDAYVRIGMRFPARLDRYFWADRYFIANYLNLAWEVRP